MSRLAIAFVMLALLVTLVTPVPGVAVAAPLNGPGSVPAHQKEVIFLGFGGTHEQNMKRHIIPKFEEMYGVKVIYVTGTMAANFARAQAGRGRPEADVLWNNDLIHRRGKAMGLFAPLDPVRVTNLAHVYDMAKDPDNIGVMQGFQAQGIEYNAKVFQERGFPVPTSWRDLWRHELHGKVGLYAGTNAYAHYFIPMVARLEGGDERNIDPAFPALAALGKMAPTFPVSPAELDNLFKQEEVWIGTNGSSRVYELQQVGFPVDFAYPEEGALVFGNWFDILEGAPNMELAQEFVNFLISEEAQRAFAVNVYFGPINKNTVLSPEEARYVPYGPEQVESLVQLDFDAMSENLSMWVERYAKEVEGR